MAVSFEMLVMFSPFKNFDGRYAVTGFALNPILTSWAELRNLRDFHASSRLDGREFEFEQRHNKRKKGELPLSDSDDLRIF